ncbi:MAG: beta-ketoacyl-[acyl-carrier-protein] synthase family protein [Planctomycetia bacterium]|nr:beta-ketoacyl-[acyl-carrier-protein] synthase family protein [Planctomycetia bacterium]
MSTSSEQVVVTGLGVVSPIGIGLDLFWSSLMEGRSGIRPLTLFDASLLPIRFGGEVLDFDPKQRVRPRKSLKVMSRDIQLAFAAADEAYTQATIAVGAIDPERFGVVFGSDLIQPDPIEAALGYKKSTVDGEFDFTRWGEVAMQEIYPLWMLKHLPNMPACHIGIAFDARGPNNTITLGEVSSLSAIGEAMRVVARGQADLMFAGGTGVRVQPTSMVRNSAAEASHRNDDPEHAMRPFDAEREGETFGEGAGAAMLESRRSAQRRGANILARVAGFGSAFGREKQGGVTSVAIAQSIERALADAELSAGDVGFVSAQGRGTRRDDAAEAQGIRSVLGDVPVTVPKSYYGNLGSGGGAVDFTAAVAALLAGRIPPTLNYTHPDPECPVAVVHGAPQALEKPTALILSQTPMGQAVAIVVVREA